MISFYETKIVENCSFMVKTKLVSTVYSLLFLEVDKIDKCRLSVQKGTKQHLHIFDYNLFSIHNIKQ